MFLYHEFDIGMDITTVVDKLLSLLLDMIKLKSASLDEAILHLQTSIESWESKKLGRTSPFQPLTSN